ncbi:MULTISPECIES: hypothetical protein [unclassified Agarivorans]|uniref:hypothetical protein n=1 Tax=unclassified Agarivorans TaxID=2636026 RepID=UPI0026E13D4A|nr:MULTISPECIES: hypothetical protein [unclassified Agarivorans]MDO6686635.1 hypothetical protein [Agarivorans sp. 3_MG-2023]MDO6717732.1 hypothetical protein [Agarivorans sp. 2_MG-2023]
MMYKIKLDERPVGYAVAPAKPGDKAAIEYRGLTVQSEGREFIRKVKSLDTILSKLPTSYQPHTIKTFVAIINNELEAKVYINESDVLAKISVGRVGEIEKGEPIRLNDILHVQEVSFEGIEFPKDCAYLALLDQGWDRVFYYDFGPLLENENKREIDYSVTDFLSYGYSRALFYETYDVSEDDWVKVTSSGWFPFAFTTYEQQKSLIQHIIYDWDYSHILEDINKGFSLDHQQWLDSIFSNTDTSLAKHKGRVEKALKFHNQGDYDTAVHLLYPRLESALRDDFLMSNPEKKGQDQKRLSKHIGQNISNRSYSFSRYFPEQFSTFLTNTFFHNYDPHSDTNPASRNSVSHGAIDESAIGMKESLIGFLIFDQIHRYIKFNKSVVAESQKKTCNSDG